MLMMKTMFYKTRWRFYSFPHHDIKNIFRNIHKNFSRHFHEAGVLPNELLSPLSSCCELQKASYRAHQKRVIMCRFPPFVYFCIQFYIFVQIGCFCLYSYLHTLHFCCISCCFSILFFFIQFIELLHILHFWFYLVAVLYERTSLSFGDCFAHICPLCCYLYWFFGVWILKLMSVTTLTQVNHPSVHPSII